SVPALSTDSDFKNRVKLSPYYYSSDDGTRIHRAALCFEPNGKLWIGDTATGRMLRFNENGTNAIYDTNFMFVPHTYRVSVDPNNQQRVFNEYLEFIVDYNQPITNGWTPTNFWGYDMLPVSGS